MERTNFEGKKCKLKIKTDSEEKLYFTAEILQDNDKIVFIDRDGLVFEYPRSWVLYIFEVQG